MHLTLKVYLHCLCINLHAQILDAMWFIILVLRHSKFPVPAVLTAVYLVLTLYVRKHCGIWENGKEDIKTVEYTLLTALDVQNPFPGSCGEFHDSRRLTAV